MRFRDYCAVKAMNWSSLKHMATSPHAYRYWTTHEQNDTKGKRIGRALHSRWLQPDVYGDEFACFEGTRRGKDWEKFKEEHGGSEIIVASEAETVERCAEALDSNPEAAELLKGARVEQTALWSDPHTGINCKGRLDLLRSGQWGDLKSTNSIAKFVRDFENLLYRGQFAWYGDGGALAKMVDPDDEVKVIVVETSEPYDSAVLTVPTDIISDGRRLYRGLLDLWYQCTETGIWPGHFGSGGIITRPSWAYSELEDSEL